MMGEPPVGWHSTRVRGRQPADSPPTLLLAEVLGNLQGAALDVAPH